MKLYPSLRYQDAKAAYRWLQDAFGFEPHELYEDDAGGVAHAEMRWGSDLIMLGSARDDAYGDRVGLGWTYVSCDDPDALCERARAAGAEITREPFDTDYGSRDFAARDPEGNQWNFGTYEPT